MQRSDHLNYWFESKSGFSTRYRFHKVKLMRIDYRVRRRDLLLGGALFAGTSFAEGQQSTQQNGGFRRLFDGVSLAGWKPQPRDLAKPSLGTWTVRDGMIVGGQDPPGLGSYLVTEESFDDFELQIEARPDWPVDTGIYVRTVPQGNVGFQVLLDHRPHGGIGGYYGNGLGGFHAYAYAFNAVKDEAGNLVRLAVEEPSEPTHRIPLDFAAPAEVFLRVWKTGGWNQFRIRCVGALPHLTTWINGERISELDTANIQSPGYDPKAVLEKLGRSGRIALEVHDNDARLGLERWGRGCVCRWRNISIRKMPS